MKFKVIYYLLLGIAASAFFHSESYAQYEVKGTVFDSSRQHTIESVTVISSSGHITYTDTLGRYKIEVSEQDSIWFLFLGRPTPKYPVLKIADVSQFDIALNLNLVTKGNLLPGVTIRTRLYKEDSINNRREYKKAFEFKRPNLASMTSVNATGAGIDLQELIRVFQFRKNKSMEKFRERLIQQEMDKFIDHRFNKLLVKELTALENEQLDIFMARYRPSYEFCLHARDYDFRLYIKTAGEQFKSGADF